MTTPVRTEPAAVADLERRRLRVDRLMRGVPYAALGASVLLVTVGGILEVLPQQPLVVGYGLSLLAAAWVASFVTLHPQWENRRRLMTVFFAGLLAIILALIWASPLYGFFGWSAYVLVPYALRGRWRLLGAAGVAVTAAISQLGGYSVLDDGKGRTAFFVVLVINVVIGTGMTHLAITTHEQSLERAGMLDELAAANSKLAAAVSENAGLHAQLLTQAREAGVLDERQRMAGEIHDVLAQGLTGIVTQLEAADAAAARPADWRRHLDAAKRLARDSLTEARRSVQALRPQNLDEAALPEAIGEVVEGWSALNGVNAELITTGTPKPLLPEIETTLLRTAQEALANVARHAAAQRVALTLSYMEDMVTLDVRDDGAGFDPSAPREPGPEGGFGLSAMRERVVRIAGTLEVESEPGGGTAISACVPALGVAA
ncbi:sensor histidine kinase [Actinoplanes sp. NPDC051343]|uniref:sensor histidine kinase n=1 Tax=Actinoplanes sp. NPDC051343 TaxID=3363906 RepID=UPI0037920597